MFLSCSLLFFLVICKESADEAIDSGKGNKPDIAHAADNTPVFFRKVFKSSSD